MDLSTEDLQWIIRLMDYKAHMRAGQHGIELHRTPPRGLSNPTSPLYRYRMAHDGRVSLCRASCIRASSSSTHPQPFSAMFVLNLYPL